MLLYSVPFQAAFKWGIPFAKEKSTIIVTYMTSDLSHILAFFRRHIKTVLTKNIPIFIIWIKNKIPAILLTWWYYGHGIFQQKMFDLYSNKQSLFELGKPGDFRFVSRSTR